MGIAGKIVKIKGQNCSRGKPVKQGVPECIWQSTIELPNQINTYIHISVMPLEREILLGAKSLRKSNMGVTDEVCKSINVFSG